MFEEKQLTPFEIIRRNVEFNFPTPARKPQSEEAKQKRGKAISLALKGRTGALNSHFGKKHSEESKRKISEAHKWRVANDEEYMRRKRETAEIARQHITQESIEKRSKVLIGRKMSEETKLKESISHKGLQCGEKHGMFGNHHTEEARARISKSMNEQWQNPEFKEKRVKAIIKGSFNRPSSVEEKLQALLDYVCPEEYIYNGDGEIVIGKQNPDFFNVNGQKKIIEMFGDYWHSEYVTGKPEEEEVESKISRYAKYGFKCLIIWERELSEPELVIEKIKEFNII